MSSTPHILVVAATDRELASSPAWRTLHCGAGPVEAAAATAAAIAAARPAAVLNVGIAGARGGCDVRTCDVVIGTAAVYCDLDVPEQWAPSRVEAPAGLVVAVRRALPDAHALPIGTSARVGGAVDCDIEAMEGFGVLRAAELAGVPALEVRVISNVVEESDRALWRFDDAFELLASVTPRVVAAIAKAAARA